jgi:hypothetical protein
MMIPVTMDVPPGWVLCDGNNTTPQLCDASYSRFPRGSDANTSSTNGGSSNIDTNHIPAHSHDISSNVEAYVDISNSGKDSYLIAQDGASVIINTQAEAGNGLRTCSKFILQNSGQTGKSLIGIEQFSFRKEANDQNKTPFNTPNYDLSVTNYGNNTNSLNRYLPPSMPFKFIKYTG